MSPAFATGYDDMPVVKWENNLDQAEAALAAGKSLVAVGVGPREDDTRQTYSLASYLLITNGDQAFFRYMSNETGESFNSLWIYPNYEIKLGQPIGPRVKTGTTWRRDFQCGYVEVVPKDRTGTIVQAGCGSASCGE